MTDEELRKALDDAAERGAKLALQRIGLADENAGRDVQDLRDLIDGWRSVKSTVTQTVTRTITMIILGAVAAGLFMNIKG